MHTELTLRAAVDDDVETLMRWFDSIEACQQWGGPHFRYPATADQFIADTRLHELASYVLEDGQGQTAAFGQWYERAGNAHLGRLAVAPARRGQRIGAALIRALLREACAAQAYTRTSLLVYASNAPAVACYTALGYALTPLPEDAPSGKDLLFLTASVDDLLGRGRAL